MWNAQQDLATPDVHKEIAAFLSRNSRSRRNRLLLMAFRGCGKSTLVGLFCAWLLCHNRNARILIVAADEALAENMLRHVRHIIESHPLAQSMLPVKKQLWSADRLLIERPGITRDPSVRAAGVHSNLTGSRADIIICDDVEVPNTSDTALKRDRLRQALNELDFILTPGGLIAYIGTPHAEDSLYKKDSFLSAYERLEIPLTEATWPERFTPDTIATIRQAVGPRVFASQMLLQPLNLKEARLDPQLVGVYRDAPDSIAGHCTWDPAFGHERGDASVIALVLFDKAGNAYVHDMEFLRVRPDAAEDEATQQCLRVIDFIRRHDLRSVQIETNGIGQFLPGLLRRLLKEAGVRCAVHPVHTGTNKTRRILQAFDARLAARSLFVHERVSRTGFLSEMAAWQPDAAGTRDDALDAVAAALLLHAPRFLSAPSYTLQPDESL